VAGALRKPPAVNRVLQQVTATVRHHQMFSTGGAVVAAVSGGADSLCLLHSLVRLRRLLRIGVVCFHFDHRLRRGSEEDAAYVRRQAKRLGVPFVLRAATSGPQRGESVEAWARTNRYAALLGVAEELGAEAAVAHTADDQAETVLLALLRGGGLEAISGMKPVTRPVVRPLIDVTRDQTVAFCGSLHLRPRQDPMNDDPRLMRAALRRSGIPALEKALGRGVRDSLVRTASLLRADADFLEDLTMTAGREVIASGDGDALLRADALATLAPPVGSRVVRLALFGQGLVPESAHVEAVLGLATARPGTSIDLPGALKAKREREYVRVSRPSPGPRDRGGPRRDRSR
jgi:tRNA(Ile)-lysidine synthase